MPKWRMGSPLHRLPRSSTAISAHNSAAGLRLRSTMHGLQSFFSARLIARLRSRTRHTSLFATSSSTRLQALQRDRAQHASVSLDRVDGFSEDEGKRESDNGAVVLHRLLAAECDALEALQFAHGLLDPRSSTIE